MSVTLRGVTDVDTPDAPFQLADMAPRRRLPVIALLLLAAVLVGGGVVLFAATRGKTSPAGGGPSASASASESLALLSENDACVQLNPLLLQSSEIYSAYVKSDDVPTTDVARRLADELRAVRKVAPADMGPDIGQIVKGLVLLPGGGAGVNFEDWQNSGLRLTGRCIGAR